MVKAGPPDKPASGSWAERLAATLRSPVRTLALQEREPSWLLPLFASASCSTAASLYVVSRIGFPRLMRAAIDSAMAFDADSAVQNVLARKGQILFFQGASIFVGTFVTAFVIAKVLWLVLLLVRGEVSFRKVLAVVAHATLFVTAVQQAMLALTVTVMQNVEAFDIRNPLATNAAFFWHGEHSAAVRLLGALDVITAAKILLIAIGLTKVANPLSLRAACLMVALPWGAYTAASVFLLAH
jgi:hypothetical protein